MGARAEEKPWPRNRPGSILLWVRQQAFTGEVGLLMEGLRCRFKFKLAPTSSRSPQQGSDRVKAQDGFGNNRKDVQGSKTRSGCCNLCFRKQPWNGDGSAQGVFSGICEEDLKHVKKWDPCLIAEVSVDFQSLQKRKIGQHF